MKPTRTHPPDPSTEGRLLALDALRGLMALAVAVYHFQVWTHVFKSGSRASNAVITFGIHSVEGFFIISGFCFFYLYRGQPFDLAGGRAFYIKRYFRIAPLYYAALLSNFVLHQQVGPFTAGRLVENLTLSFGLFHPNHALVLGGWSIGVEFVFYLAFPLLVWLARVPGALLGACLLLAALAFPMNFHQVPEAPELQRFNAYVRVSNHAFLFVLGGLFAALRTRLTRRLSTPVLAVLCTSIVVGTVRALPTFYDHFYVMTEWPRVGCLTACSALVLAAGLHRAGPSRALAPLVWLGDLSYAVYLLHPFAWLAVSGVLPTAEQPWLPFSLGLALTVLLAALAHYLLERPMQALGRSLAGRRSRCAESQPIAESTAR